jgi:putative transposase
MRTAPSLLRLVSILLDLAQDALQFLLLGTRSSAALKAENIFLRKQLALYLEREAKPRRATDATRLSMVLLSRLFAWQKALINVKPETFLGWETIPLLGWKRSARWSARIYRIWSIPAPLIVVGSLIDCERWHDFHIVYW